MGIHTTTLWREIKRLDFKTKDGRKYYEVKDHELGFKIRLNPLRSKERPETFVTVRHVLVDHKSFHFLALKVLLSIEEGFDRKTLLTMVDLGEKG